jgi:opacity protein-like surface antigen
MKRLILALVTAAALTLPAISAHANPNGPKQNGICQNGTISLTTGKCVNNPK